MIGGDGDDTLIGTGGFDSLDGGQGRNSVSTVGSMGTIWAGPSVSGDALRILRRSYTVRTMGSGAGSATGPIVVGTADLLDDSVVTRLKAAYDAGQPVGLTQSDKASSAMLQTALGHPQSANHPANDPAADLVVFRHSTRPDGGHNYTSAVLKQRLPAPRGARALSGERVADQGSTAWLSRTFAAIAADPANRPIKLALGDSPMNDLTQLADSYYQSTLGTGGEGDQLQLDNTIWNVRSFSNGNDYYYVGQDILATYGNDIPTNPYRNVTNDLYNTSPSPTLIDPAPQTTQLSTTYTHEVTWNIGGSVGYNAMQGANGSISGGVGVSNSTSYTVPPVIVTFTSDLTLGIAEWNYNSQAGPDLQHPQVRQRLDLGGPTIRVFARPDGSPYLCERDSLRLF